jgi:hypothetical protein
LSVLVVVLVTATVEMVLVGKQSEKRENGPFPNLNNNNTTNNNKIMSVSLLVPTQTKEIVPTHTLNSLYPPTQNHS